MASVKTMVGEKILIKIGDGATPTETFSHPCMINLDRGLAFSSDSTDVVVPDCDDPSAVAWKEVYKDGLSLQISGGGLLHTLSLETYFNWMTVDTSKNVQVLFNVSAADGGGYISGAFKLTSFGISGTRKNNATVDLTLMSHGALTWTDAS